MRRVVLGLTGSVAAIRSFELVDLLERSDSRARIVATSSALYFLDPAQVSERRGRGDSSFLIDADEWPGAGYRRGDPVGHIELRRWADVLVVAPLDANTLAKFALGLSDNLLTCLFRAWDFTKPVVLAPAMNTLMWESPVTRRHLQILLEDRAESTPPADWTFNQVQAVFARHAPAIVLVPPQSKRLACGDIGTGAMADIDEITQAVVEWRQGVDSEV